MKDRKQEIDTLFSEARKEYDDPEKLEFYETVKTDKIVALLLQDEEFTLAYLSAATKEFFDFMFCEFDDTADVILQKFPDARMKAQLRALCAAYRDDGNAEAVDAMEAKL